MSGKLGLAGTLGPQGAGPAPPLCLGEAAWQPREEPATRVVLHHVSISVLATGSV